MKSVRTEEYMGHVIKIGVVQVDQGVELACLIDGQTFKPKDMTNAIQEARKHINEVFGEAPKPMWVMVTYSGAMDIEDVVEHDGKFYTVSKWGAREIEPEYFTLIEPGPVADNVAATISLMNSSRETVLKKVVAAVSAADCLAVSCIRMAVERMVGTVKEMEISK